MHGSGSLPRSFLVGHDRNGHSVGRRVHANGIIAVASPPEICVGFCQENSKAHSGHRSWDKGDGSRVGTFVPPPGCNSTTSFCLSTTCLATLAPVRGIHRNTICCTWNRGWMGGSIHPRHSLTRTRDVLTLLMNVDTLHIPSRLLGISRVYDLMEETQGPSKRQCLLPPKPHGEIPNLVVG